jgi:hypothetical protein
LFSIFPAGGLKEESEQYPAADSPAFFTIHNPLAALEMEFAAAAIQSPTAPSPALAIEDLRSSQGVDKRTPRTKEMEGRGREGSGSRAWDGADSKEMLARELGLLLQNNPQFLRSMSAEVASASAQGAGAVQGTLSTQGHVLLEELMNSLAAGGGDYGGDLVRPISGHFSRIAHLEDQLKDSQSILEHERNARRATEEANAKVAAQIAQAQEEARRALELSNHGSEKEVAEAVRKVVHTLDSIVVNTGKGLTPRDRETASLADTIEGLKEENATLDRLYRQTKAELEGLQAQEVKEGGGAGHDSLRKKNQQLTKELELLHKDYEALLQVKGDDADDSDEFIEDKRVGGRRKGKSSGFLKRIIG